MDAVTKPDKMAEDSEDEDLEALRLAALQSIKSKPTVIAPRRRPKPIGRPFRKRRGNFHQGRVNTNLISIVPLELPLDQAEPSKQSDPPPPLVLPQDRYCKTEVKEKIEEKKISVPSKFSRFEDSNSGDSDDDYEEDFLNQSSESEKPDDSSDKNNKVDSESVLEDDDELLLQDEDSLGTFFNEFELETNIDEPSRKTSNPKKDKQDAKSSDRRDKNRSVDSGAKGGNKVNDKCSSVKDSKSKSAVEEKRSNESQETRLSKGDKSKTKDNVQDHSPRKEDDKRINRPCVYGRNRSPSPLTRGRTFDKNQQLPKRGGRNSPSRRKISPSTESVSPVGRREQQQLKTQLPPAKSLHPSKGDSPHEVTPPHWGSRSDSNHGMGLPLGAPREWSSSPHKWSSTNAPSSSLNSPNKSTSPSRQRRRSRSPLHKGSRSWERDWSGSPQQKKSRDVDTPPGSQRSSGDGSKAIKRKSSSPISDRRDRSRSGHSKDRSYSPRGVSPSKHHVHSPSKLPRRVSPVRSSSRTPSLSPSPEPQGKSSSRRYKSPLRLPGYRLPNHRDNRMFRPDSKTNRKDNDRRAVRLNGPPRKGPESKVELPKMRPYNARLEVKVTEPSPPKKSETERDAVSARSPNKGAVTNSWSSDEGQSDSESRFKGTESKVVKPVVISSKIMSAVPKTKEPEETSSSERRSPKKKKSKRSKKSFSKVKGAEVEDAELTEKQTNDGDLRAELSRRRAERVNKAKNVSQSMPVRLVQSAFQGLTSKLNPIEGERGSVNLYSSKSEVSTDSSVSKKKPIHLRLGLPVSRNPDPPESRLSANCPLPRASDCDKEEASNVSVDGGNKWKKIKLKRNVTVQKSLSRGTTSPVTNTSGKEQVMSVSQLMLLNLAGLCPGSSYGNENPAPSSPTPLPCLSHYLVGILLSHHL